MFDLIKIESKKQGIQLLKAMQSKRAPARQRGVANATIIEQA